MANFRNLRPLCFKFWNQLLGDVFPFTHNEKSAIGEGWQKLPEKSSDLIITQYKISYIIVKKREILLNISALLYAEYDMYYMCVNELLYKHFINYTLCTDRYCQVKVL